MTSMSFSPRLSFALAALASSGAARAEPASTLPPPADILGTLRSVNGYFMQHHPDPGQPSVAPSRPGEPPKLVTRPSNLWTRAVDYEGLMALYRIDRDPRYDDYAISWGESHHWDLIGGPATIHADNQCCGQTYLDLYAQDPKPERIAELQASLQGMIADPKTDNAWWWCDALQMAMPVFARLGVLNHDPRYFEKMYALYWDAKTRQGGPGLYNPADHLWWRDRTFLPPFHEPNGRNSYWARGNGWVLTALARVLDVLPADAPHRDEYVRTFRDMAAAILPRQRPDGFWNVSLDDPDDFGGKEVTGTALFVYGFARGIQLGLLAKDDYEPAIARAWNGLAQDAVHPNGFLGYVQGTGKQPSDGQPVTYDKVPDYEDFGTGCFLLAGTEAWKLAGGIPSK
jgi:unsaturated rhamnogalacturonyl hydrolase